MKRKLNENYEMPSIYLDLTAIAADDPIMDFNALRDTFVEMGADVKPFNNGHVIMVIDGLDIESIKDVLDLELLDGVDDSYFVDIYSNNNLTDVEDYPAYDDIDEDDYPAYEDLDEDAGVDDIFNRCINALQNAVNRGIIYTKDDIDDNIEQLMDEVVVDQYNLSDDEWNDIADMFYDAWDLVDFSLDTDLDDDEYIPSVEKMRRPHLLSEKRRRCCPGKSVNEKLKAFNDKDQNKLNTIEKSVKDIISDLDSTTIGAHEAREAFKKLRAENAKLRKIQKSEDSKFNVNDVAGVKKALNTIKKADPENAKDIDKFQKTLTEKVNNHLKTGKSYLHENVKYGGRSFKDMTVFELKALYDKVLEEKKKLSQSIKNTLNESDFTATKEKLQKKNQLLNFIDEELTYRVVRQRCLKHLTEGVALNEDGGEITDEELANLFGPGQGEEETSDNDETSDTSNETSDDNNDDNSEDNNDSENSDEEDEEVELSRIEITLKTKEAAEDLKQACIDADIPEDAMEIEEPESDEDDESEENSDDEEESTSEEDTEEETSDENTESETPNESIYYRNIRKLLFEGEVADGSEETTDTTDETAEENTEEQSNDDSAEDNTESEETDEESGVKFILTNTDYALQLAKVLEDQYGISKDEFEEMIGGEIIDEESEEDDENDDNATEDSDKDSDESNDDTSMDPSELFKGL